MPTRGGKKKKKKNSALPAEHDSLKRHPIPLSIHSQSQTCPMLLATVAATGGSVLGNRVAMGKAPAIHTGAGSRPSCSTSCDWPGEKKGETASAHQHGKLLALVCPTLVTVAIWRVKPWKKRSPSLQLQHSNK